MLACSSSQTAPAFAANPPCFCHRPLFARVNSPLAQKVLLQPVLAVSGSGKGARAIPSKKVAEPSVQQACPVLLSSSPTFVYSTANQTNSARALGCDSDDSDHEGGQVLKNALA